MRKCGQIQANGGIAQGHSAVQESYSFSTNEESKRHFSGESSYITSQTANDKNFAQFSFHKDQEIVYFQEV